VKDYPQLSIRLPMDVKARLHALSLLSAKPQWRLVSEAVDCYLRRLPESDQQLVGDLLGRTRPKTPRT
jgi:predicted DNA-binding protein